MGSPIIDDPQIATNADPAVVPLPDSALDSAPDDAATLVDRLAAGAIHCLAAAMSVRLGQDPVLPDPDVTARATLVVNATLDRSGNRFAVLIDGSQHDATRLAVALLAVQGMNHEPRMEQLFAAGEAITRLVNDF